MKLGILCTMINGFGKRGFYNTQEVGLGRALVKKGHTVVIYKCVRKEKDRQTEKIEIAPGLTILYLPTGGMGIHGYLASEKLEKNMDGLLCFSDNQIFMPHIFRFCKKNRIPIVPYIGITYSLHKGLQGKLINILFRLGTLRFYKKIPVIAKTEAADRKLRALGVNDISVAPVGLDISVLKSDFKKYGKTGLRAEYGIEADAVLLCSITQMTPSKRPLDMVEIFRHIRGKKKFRMLLVGDGPLREKVENKIAFYGLTGEIKIINRIPYSEIWKIYAMSDYFINLNRNEIFGMAVMEAVYYETSAVAFRTAPGPSMTLKGMKGHCLCEDDRQAEEWLTAPYPSEKDLEESSKKGIRRFSWNGCSDSFLEKIKKR